MAGEFTVTPEKRDAFMDIARAITKPTRQEEGCHFFEFWSDLAGEGRFAVLEGWESADHLRKHRETPHVAAFRTAIGELGIERTEFKWYEAEETEV